jgi:hypothetical protein
MRKSRPLAAAIAVAGAAALAAGSAGAAVLVSSDGLWQLATGAFGAGTGVHFTGSADDVTSADAIVNKDDSGVVISSSDTFDTNGSGEATVADGNGGAADPYTDLALDFEHAWGDLTFALSGTKDATFTLSVNGGPVVFSSANCSFCKFGNGNTHFILTSLSPTFIDTVNFAFSGDGLTTGATTAKQFRVRRSIDDIGAPDAVPEPGAWLMMILGFGAAGALMRRRQSVAWS